MKNTNQSIMSLGGMAKLFYFFAFLGLSSITAFSQTTFNPVIFTTQKNDVAPDGVFRIRGDFSMIGNKNLTAIDATDGDNGAGTPMRYVDVDGVAATVNSSSVVFNFSTDEGACE